MKIMKCDYQLSEWVKEKQELDSMVETLVEHEAPFKVETTLSTHHGEDYFAVFVPKLKECECGRFIEGNDLLCGKCLMSVLS